MSKVEYKTTHVGHQRFYIDSRYENLKQIGDGSYGFVASAYDTVTGRHVAIKKIKNVFLDVVDAKRILRELKLLRHLKGHENITTIYDIMSVPPNTKNMDDVYIVTNLLETDLEHVIQSRQVLSDQHLQYFLYQILRALKYVHSANVLHRDLKPSNILANANCDLALCDFGLARGIEGTQEEILTEYVVTRWYRAPELLCHCTSYGKPVDIWSVGCIFYELISGRALFRGDNSQHQLKIIVQKLGCPSPEKLKFIPSQTAIRTILEYSDHIPRPFEDYFPSDTNPQAIDLIRKMLQFHPSDRISADEALNHRYFSDYHGQVAEPVARGFFDFDFEKHANGSRDMSESEVRTCMFEEIKKYRQCTEPDMADDFSDHYPSSKSAYEQHMEKGGAKDSHKSGGIMSWMKRK